MTMTMTIRVADTIRRGQQIDAIPTVEKVKIDHQRFLASRGCTECDEDDPDQLDTYTSENAHLFGPSEAATGQPRRLL